MSGPAKRGDHRREANRRAVKSGLTILARSSAARVRRRVFPLDIRLHGRRPFEPISPGLRSTVLMSRGHRQRFAFFRKQYGEKFSWFGGTRVARNGVKLAGRFHPHLAGRVGFFRFIVDL